MSGTILVVNCGSSSIKYRLFKAEGLEEIAGGILERIGSAPSIIKHRTGARSTSMEVDVPDHRSGLKIILNMICMGPTRAIASTDEILAVGHRVVHGGDIFVSPTEIDDRVIDTVKELADLAPLHNPHNIAGIEAARSLLPGTPQVAIFDTSFHQSMPEKAYAYAIPFEIAKKNRIRRYGFHGTSHRFVSLKAAEMMGAKRRELRMITCHLGNGCSIAAIKRGRSIDTSMGFTPLEGLVMGTRSGDIDPSIILHLMHKERLSTDEAEDLLNRKSGLLGISGVSNDVRDIEAKAANGDARCILALEVFAYRAKKYIGAYAAALGGIDALIFTGGIGENDPLLRRMICDGMEFFGIKLNDRLNALPLKGPCEIGDKSHHVKIFVIPTDEELEIADETLALLHLQKRKTNMRGYGPKGK